MGTSRPDRAGSTPQTGEGAKPPGKRGGARGPVQPGGGRWEPPGQRGPARRGRRDGRSPAWMERRCRDRVPSGRSRAARTGPCGGEAVPRGVYTTNSSGWWSSPSRSREREFTDLLGPGSSARRRGQLRGAGRGARRGAGRGAGRASSTLRLCGAAGPAAARASGTCREKPGGRPAAASPSPPFSPPPAPAPAELPPPAGPPPARLPLSQIAP